jgi:benzylsuccinate CoA-transferase BbsE subunit
MTNSHGNTQSSPPTTPAQPPGNGPLAGVRVLDLTDALAAYAGRLLADLGADVIRIESPGGRGEVEIGPFWMRPGERPVSLFERFVNAGKRSVSVDLAAPEASEVVAALLSHADVVLESSTRRLAEAGWDDARVNQLNGSLIRVLVTPYGGEFAGGPVDDLILLGAGGLLSLGGYPDAGPVAAYGYQSTYMASIFAAVAAVAGLIGRQRTNEGLSADVSAQECVAQALEESVVGYALTGEVRAPQGDTAKEAGTGVYRCADGYISVVAGRLGTAAAWKALVGWISDSDPRLAERLADERWSQFEYRRRPEAINEFKEIFEDFAKSRTRQELYREAQARGIALSPVNDLAAVLEDAQLRSRNFFVPVDDPELARTVTYPGLPYRMSVTPLAGPRPAPRRGADTVEVLTTLAGLAPEDVECLAERGVV